jgi:hypothetical protein
VHLYSSPSLGNYIYAAPAPLHGKIFIKEQEFVSDYYTIQMFATVNCKLKKKNYARRI